MLSRLATAITDVNRGFTSYDFSTATTALYNVWQYELCDVYLVCICVHCIYSKKLKTLHLIVFFRKFSSQFSLVMMMKPKKQPKSLCTEPWT